MYGCVCAPVYVFLSVRARVYVSVCCVCECMFCVYSSTRGHGQGHMYNLFVSNIKIYLFI